MSDREGVPPEGGAPDRSPPESADSASADGRAPNGSAPNRSAPNGSAEARGAREVAAASEPNGVGGAPVTGPIDTGAPVSPPTEPTLRADPSVREFEVPFDTGELHRVPTGQLLVVHRPELRDQAYAADEEQDDTQRRVYSWVAAVFGVIGAAASLFVGWMLPLSIAALVFGVLGLRREEEGRNLAFVGIGTGIAGLVFGAVWIGYYAIVFGALPH